MPRITGMLVGLLLVLALFAFWPLYLSRPFAEVDRYTHFHAAVALAWMLLLLVQPWLVRRRRLDLHRLAGRATWLVAPLFVLSGVLLAHFRFAAMDDRKFEAEAFTLYLPLHSVVLFALLYGLGLRYRSVPAAHGRFMVATALLLIDPVVGRVLYFHFPPLPAPWLYQAITYGLVDLLALALVLSFRGPAPARRALAGMLAILVAAQALWFAFAPSATWLAFAAWFRGLPLT